MNYGVETFTGIRPTADLTVANYLGAVKPLLNKEAAGEQTSIFLAELHAATTTPPSDVREHSKTLTRTLMASGVEGEIYSQYDIRDLVSQTELSIRGLTSVARVLRLPTLKEKVTQSDNVETANVALAMYPMMMAADIILARPAFVPTGKDQKPHLEITNELIRSLNREYGTELPEPREVTSDPINILSLDHSGRKMSKTIPSGALYLDDDNDAIRRKIKKAPTASEPGAQMDTAIDNLTTIGVGLSVEDAQKRELETLGQRVKDGERVTGHFKELVGDVVVDFLTQLNEQRASVSDSDMKARLQQGHDLMRPIGQETLDHIEDHIWNS